MGLRLSCALHTVVELHPSVGSALVFYHITSALLHFFFFLTNASVLKVLKKTQTSVSFPEFETYIAFLLCAKNKKEFFPYVPFYLSNLIFITSCQNFKGAI